MSTNKIVINGSDLTPEIIARFVHEESLQIQVSPKALQLVKKTNSFLNTQTKSKVIYGINTGFGPMASHILGKEQLLELQRNLIVSHAVGMGSMISPKYVLAAMVVRLNTLAKGHSGVSTNLILHLQKFINLRIIPVVPEHGAVGTSGDLVQLAHIALALIGEGSVVYEGKVSQTAKILKKLGIKPYILQPKEGLSLINGTSAMTGISSLLCEDAERLMSIALRNGALALEIIHGFNDAISEKLQLARPHHGQMTAAKVLRNLLKGSKLLRDRKTFQKHVEVGDDVKEIPESVQDVYSFRCMPQIIGPVLDTWAQTYKTVLTEMNAVTDNPIVDLSDECLLHGGNFHGDYIANAIDQLKIVLVKMTMLAERRVNFLLNRAANKFLPPFLNLKKPGLTLALQGLQFVATSTTSQSQTLAFPQYIHSIPTNADNQDIVSMGTDASLLTAKVIENAFIVQAIETIALAQALDYTKDHAKISASSTMMYEKLRAVFPAVIDDRVVTEQLPHVVEFLRDEPSIPVAELKRSYNL